jgi:hypothetical protein
MGRNMHYIEQLSKINLPTFQSFSKWLGEMFTPDYRKEIEAYLADSVDTAEVERKIIELSRRGII